MQKKSFHKDISIQILAFTFPFTSHRWIASVIFHFPSRWNWSAGKNLRATGGLLLLEAFARFRRWTEIN